MRRWSASSLSAVFSRVVIGFDIRQCPQDGKIIATINSEKWPRPENLSSDAADENGLNLFLSVPTELTRLFPNARPVAFDLPTDLVNSLASTFGLIPLPLNEVSATGEWEFAGYDVVDPRTQSSAFYSFDWSESELLSLLGRLSLTLNRLGIVDDVDAAIRAAIAFDKEIPEHAPFAPCGVWVHRASPKT